ncbi:MAG: hypothetical protein ACP5T0_07925 [Verrucomicrobiia bacterium]
MADNIPNLPQGAVPPSPDQSKVQPKKETVRIQLPPKPTSAPTIKLPTLPQAGAAPTPTVPPPKPNVPSPAAAPPPAAATPSAAIGSRAQPVPPPQGAGAAKLASTPGPKTEQPAPAAKKEQPKAPTKQPGAVATVSVLDKALAIAAMVTSLAAVFTVIYLFTLLQDALKGGGQ